MKNAINSISICIDDLKALPGECFRKSEKNGKTYLSLTVAGRKEPDQYGNDLTVYVSQTKEQRETKADKKYVGEGRHIDFTKQGGGKPEDMVPQEANPWDGASGDDLPY